MKPQSSEPRAVCRLHGSRPRTAGQALVEFALVAPILVFLLLMAIDFGRLFTTYISVVNAAREGASYGITNPGCLAGTGFCADPNNITFRARQELGGDTSVQVSRACVTSCSSSAGVQANRITVVVTKNFTFLTPFLSTGFGALWGGFGVSLPVTASATGAIL